MSTAIVVFSKAHHLEQTVDVLLQVRRSNPEYPPPADAVAQRESMTDWLLTDEVLARWVATSGEHVVGHIQVTRPHSYLQETSGQRCQDLYRPKDLAEIGKFFVHPSSREGGVGSLLFEQARTFIRSQKKTPVLAVLPASKKALEFYSGKGMRNCGSFVGVHGENMVFIDTPHQNIQSGAQ